MAPSASRPVAVIAVTTFLVNSRHLVYGCSFPLHRVRGRLYKAYSVFALCDEAYALMTSKDLRSLTSARILWNQLGLHAPSAVGALVGGLLVGGLLGGTVLDGLEGLDFMLTALFVVLTMDAERANPDRITLALATGAGVLALLVAPRSMVLVVMSAFAVALVVRHFTTSRPRALADPDRITLALATALGVAVAITFVLRALPFLLKGVTAGSALLADVGRWMPLGAVAILALYCVAAIDLTQAPHGLPELTGVVATVGAHWWRRNAVPSIVVGTTVCLLVTHLVS